MISAAATIPHIPMTTYPVHQLLKDLSVTLPLYFKKTSHIFSRTTLHKLDENGQVRTFNEKNQAGQIIQRQTLSYIENTRTGRIYKDETAWSLSQKCLAIVLAAPLYTISTMLWHAHQLVRSIAIVVKRVIGSTRLDLSFGRYYQATKLFYREVKVIPTILLERMEAIAKASLFGIGLLVAGLAGIPRPFVGRELVALIDHAWHHGISYKDDWRNLPSQKDPDCTALCNEIYAGKELYLAYCFQVRGNTKSDPRLRILSRTPLRAWGR